MTVKHPAAGNELGSRTQRYTNVGPAAVLIFRKGDALNIFGG